MQRRALGLLFAALAVVLAVVGAYALAGADASARRWIIAAAAFAIALWLGSLAASALRRR